jgi:hypothetical protein
MTTLGGSGSGLAVLFAALFAALALAACGDDGDDPGDGPPPGYVRFETPPITVQPGENKMWIQWVALPADEDRNIADLIGSQGPGGHHAVLYTTSEVQPVGTTRDFTNEDQADIHLVGGIGGEGGEAVKLPPGVVFRVPAGRALLVQTHYLNASDAPVEGRSTIDVKFAAPSPEDRVASFFVSSAQQIEVPAHADAERDVTCVLQEDLPMLMFTNHMHEWGFSVTTTITPPGGGAPTVLKDNPVWDSEWTFNPDYTTALPDAPVMLTKGSTITTHCEWHNTTDRTLHQPDEMCIFLGFFLGDKDATCLEGQWYQ